MYALYMVYTGVKGLNKTNERIGILMADFSGLVNLEKVVSDVLVHLQTATQVRQNVRMVKGGSMSMEQFDDWFSGVVRAELGKTLGIIRNKAIKKARDEGAGSAQTAVLRRMYRASYTGNVNIAGHHGRISNRDRVYPEPKGGESGIRRPRTVKKRTEQLRKYYGPDRDFILRILEGGRDSFMATPEGPTGRKSMATHGKRGAMSPRPFFNTLQSDMEQAAQQLGETLVHRVKSWTETKFTEN